MARLIFGCGYLGHRVARAWLQEATPVYVVTRSPQRAAQFAQEGLRPLVADVLRPETLAALPRATTVLYAVGYDRQSPISREVLQLTGLRHVLAALSPETERILYVSSTGVYGPSGGAWVDETTPCHPVREAGRVQLEAEQLLQASSWAERVIRLRIAGIYGPERIPRMADLIAGRPLEIADGGFLNLIHVDDAAAVVMAAETRCTPPQLFTVSDGHPCQRREFYRHLARLLGLPEPAFTQPEANTAARGRDNKRVANGRMLHELGVGLHYPSHEEGLAALVASPGDF